VQRAALFRFSIRSSNGDVGPGDSHVCSGVDGHESWFGNDPALCEWDMVDHFCSNGQLLVGGLNEYVALFFPGTCSFSDGLPSLLSATLCLSAATRSFSLVPACRSEVFRLVSSAVSEIESVSETSCF
jgi:hypothetical protein